MKDEIKAAMAAHGLWMNHLLNAIGTGSSVFSVAEAGREDACAFGKWLLSSEEARASTEFPTVKALHARFHEEAANVLRLALEGRAADAQTEMDSRSAYMKASSDLMLAMLEWSRHR